MVKRNLFFLFLGFLFVVSGTPVCWGSSEIRLDSASIPLGMAATGTVEIQSTSSREIVLSRGVAILRGGLSWEISRPDGSVLEISSHTSKVVINGVDHEVVIEPGTSLNIPFCLFVWGRELIFNEVGSYILTASVFIDDQSPPIVQKIPILVSESGEGFQEWEETFIRLGEIVSPFEMGYFDFKSSQDKPFAQSEIYGPCLERIFVYNIGHYNVGNFLADDSFGEISGHVKKGVLVEEIKEGLFLAEKTGYGIDMWNYISARYNFYFPEQGEFQEIIMGRGKWSIR